MIKTLLTIVKTIIAILPFFLFCLHSKKVNIDKSERPKQFPMPIVALVYIILALIFLNKINEGILWVINAVPRSLKSLSNVSWMPGFLSSFLTWLSDIIKALIRSLNLDYWIFYISNTAILVLYFLLKRILLPIFRKAVKTTGTLYRKFAVPFYTFFPENDKWCLRDNYHSARALLRIMYNTVVVLSCLLFGISGRLYQHGLLEAMFYPVVAVILIGELYFFLDGHTKREYTCEVLGEDDDALRVVNYTLLRKFLRSFFPDKLLAEKTTVNNSFSDGATVDEYIYDLEKDEDPSIANYAEFIKKLNASSKEIDKNYLSSSLDLLRGKSIIFNNPFYRDLIPYAFYPLNRVLLTHGKVLVILGRHGIENDIEKWLTDGISAVTNIPNLWRIKKLTNQSEEDIDIGIITRSEVLNIKMHNANSEFLSQVRFCFIIEPSKLISTAQVGLNLIVKKFNDSDEKKPVYCLCDKNCDGLLDAMSHILLTSLTEVLPTLKHQGTSSYMCWSTDGEDVHHRLFANISRYLGFGTELSLAALKNQISSTYWFGGEVFPVTDINWIAKQYYYDLMKYAGRPTTREAMDEGMHFSSYMWSAPKKKHYYLTAEDESNNMFEMLRNFSTRATEQGFINIISQDYMLKDYMSDNASVFETDPKAIPYISPDFVRSERNTFLKLTLMLSTFEVREKEIAKDFSLLGIKVYNLKLQLWHAIYTHLVSIAELADMPSDYTEAVRYTAKKKLPSEGRLFGSEIIVVGEKYNYHIGEFETVYSINNKHFINSFVSDLKSAEYVAEDEKGDTYYIGSELRGHIYQRYLPGQFFTFDGKYYEMMYLTAAGQLLVRRAADHITGRPAYRQIRNYHIKRSAPSTMIGAIKNVSGIKIIKEFVDMEVDTEGYYRLNSFGNFSDAKRVIFEGETTGIQPRYYNNKEILRIELPDSEGKLNDDVRYTVTVLMNELFQTIFAENAPFIAALTNTDIAADDKAVDPLTYKIDGENDCFHPGSIYIIEDSQLDLGLIVAFERNLERIMQIIYDYLDWHSEKLRLSLNPPPEPVYPLSFPSGTGENEDSENDDKKNKKKGSIKRFFKKLADWIKKKLPKKKSGEEPDKEPSEQKPSNQKKKNKKEEKQKRKEEKRKIKEEKKKQKADEKKKKNKKVDVGDPQPDNTSSDTDVSSPEDQSVTAEHSAANDVPVLPVPTVGSTLGSDSAPNTERSPIGDPEKNLIIADDEASAPDPKVDTVPDFSKTPDGDENGSAVGNEPEKQQESPNPDENSLRTVFAVKPYHERYYFLYGGKTQPKHFDVDGTREYLDSLNVKNTLGITRRSNDIAKLLEDSFKPNKAGSRYCDFCGAEIFGVEYETLSDGRDRCINCSRTAIKSEAEFKKLFGDVRRNMEAFFNISLNAGIRVEMVNAKKLHKALKKSFVPTDALDARVLGFARKDKSGFTLMLENGSPRIPAMMTMAHELTHIWQFLNWKEKKLRRKYGRALLLEIYEGMAMWAQIQYAYLINEHGSAKREEIIASLRKDVYGRGFIRFRANYPFTLGSVITRPTPFTDIETPLDPEYAGRIDYSPPRTTDYNPEPEPDPNPDRDGDGIVNSADPDPDNGPADRKPGETYAFAYDQLDTRGKSVYDSMLQAVSSFKSEITEFPPDMKPDDIYRVSDYLQIDHPELFWFQQGTSVTYSTQTGIVTKISLSYRMTEKTASERKKEIDRSLQAFLSSIKPDMSDYEVTLRVYENIINLVDYDSLNLDFQKANPDSKKPDDLRSIYGVFVNKKAVCVGYAKATQYLLNKLGIECTYVTSATHAWNLVRLEGEYYHLDTTWGDSSDTRKDKNTSNAIGYKCFCITTSDLLKLKSHIPEDNLRIPECTATACNYYRRHGLFFDRFDLNRLRRIVSDSAANRRYVVSIRCASESVYKQFADELLDKGRFFEIINQANVNLADKLDSSYKYSCSDDLFTVTFFLKKKTN